MCLLVTLVFIFFFFFKQKTAYEMRISDWSSDVCSSDLDGAPERFDNDRRAFHSSWREKLREVIARGAIGAVFVNTARDEASWPWAQRAGDWARPAMRLRGDDGEGIDPFPQLRVVAVVSEIGRAHV